MALLLLATSTGHARQAAPVAERHPEAGVVPRGSLPATSPAHTPQQNGRPPRDAGLLERSGGFRAMVEMVRVPVIVVDDDGAFIENLAADAFFVRDGGERHAVHHFVSDTAPASVGVVVDASAAMRTHEEDVRLAVAGIARNLRPGDELFLLSYGAGVAMLHEPTADREAVVAAMGDYVVSDGADRAMYDALDRGLATLEDSRLDKRSLIVVGAGGDTASASGALAVRQRIHRTGVTIHAISLAPRDAREHGLRARVNRLETLPEIVEFTGGLLARRPPLTARYGGDAVWMEAAGNSLSAYVKHQYLLHYAPQNPPRSGTWRTIRVELEAPYRELRARSGYVR